jgi:hypothetical protein
MFDDIKIPLRLSAAVGATIALFATFLPWYSFGVVLSTGEVVHLFAVTTTLWGLTTVAPTLIVVGAAVALILTAVLDARITGVVVGLIGLAIAAYAIVRLFDIPNLAIHARGARAVTELEGGPFVALAGGIMLLIGGIGELIASSAGARGAARPSPSRWQGPSTQPPQAVS